MNTTLRNALALAGLTIATQAIAQVTFYEREDFEGRSFSTSRPVSNMERFGFKDRASSLMVTGGRWEVCEDARFRGQCMILRPGRYASLSAMGMNNRISSVRTVSRNTRFDDNRFAPVPAATYAPNASNNYRRRSGERLYEANVTSVRAVVGPAEQRCWIEREQVVQDRSDGNVPGAIAGAIIGGVLGHQVGGGRGKDLATAGGAVAGAAIGANVGRDGGGQQVHTQNVQRCTSTPGHTRPEYWDVTYNFRNQEHRIQMAASPGPTVTVNPPGEPRE